MPPAQPIACQRSSSSTARSRYETTLGSSKTRAAVSNETPCFRRLIRFFFSSHAKTICIYEIVAHRRAAARIWATGQQFAWRPSGSHSRPRASPSLGYSVYGILWVWRGMSSSPMNSGIGGTRSQRNNRMMWRTLFGISSNSVPPSVSRTVQKSAVPAIRRCASCGLRAQGGRCGRSTHSTRSARPSS